MRRSVLAATIACACARNGAHEHAVEGHAVDATPNVVDSKASGSASPLATASASVSAAGAERPLRTSGKHGIAFAAAGAPDARIVYFHGMWASPEDSCSYFEPAASTHGALLCPRGNLPREAGGAWGGALAQKRRSLDELTRELEVLRTPLRREAGTLIGFSSGAALAYELALAEPGQWTGLVLMAMPLTVSPRALEKAGIRRLVLAAGELDGSYASMKSAALAASGAGLPTRFVSLGKVGHHFAVDMESRMTEVLRWVRGG